MVSRVLIIGGYGNFGSYIARSLAERDDIALIIAGRSSEKARAFAATLAAQNPIETAALDIAGDLVARLSVLRPDVVIHTTGPFQGQSYAVAEACICQGCHYIDLADARDFVAGFSSLDAAAKARGTILVSGASSVPCLTAAVLDELRPRFSAMTRVDYGISAAQQTNRGVATLAAILSYLGRPFTTLVDGRMKRVFGWQDLHRQAYPALGRRWLANCDVPDLVLFPGRYPGLKTQRFSAGAEITTLHFGLWLLSWAARCRLVRPPALAGPLRWIASRFDRLGSGDSRFHMIVEGLSSGGAPKTARFFIIARSGHGPYIPCMPAILLAKKIAGGNLPEPGAGPCLDLIDLDTYVAALQGLDITVMQDDGDA